MPRLPALFAIVLALATGSLRAADDYDYDLAECWCSD